MPSIKIIGAGSIGNHLANAARTRGWQVVLTDNDPHALERARTSIYPERYGAWDNDITLKLTGDAMADDADVVFIGTPPDSHMALAMAVLEANAPRALVIEKPLCGPDLAGCAELVERLRGTGVFAAVGYNHVLGANTVAAEKVLRSGSLGKIATISARTREHWGGIFKAHPWLPGPAGSYLGFAERGGGATGEHSHAINMWQHFARVLEAGPVVQVSASMDMVTDGGTDYDALSIMTLTTAEGLVGDVIQDVVTKPTDKSVRIQGADGFLEWRVGMSAGADGIVTGTGDDAPQVTEIAKTRADDFIAEIAHLETILAGGADSQAVALSPVALARGLDTMLVIAAAFKSHQAGRAVTIDWQAGYSIKALS